MSEFLIPLVVGVLLTLAVLRVARKVRPKVRRGLARVTGRRSSTARSKKTSNGKGRTRPRPRRLVAPVTAGACALALVVLPLAAPTGTGWYGIGIGLVLLVSAVVTAVRLTPADGIGGARS